MVDIGQVAVIWMVSQFGEKTSWKLIPQRQTETLPSFATGCFVESDYRRVGIAHQLSEPTIHQGKQPGADALHSTRELMG